MNIVIGKFGKSILFDENHWTSPNGGDNEPAKFYSCIAKFNPNINFYLIGKSDFSRLSKEKKNEVCPNNNIFDTYSLIKNFADDENICLNNLNNIKIDAGVLFSGPSGNANIPNKILTIQKNKEGQIAKVLEIFKNYCAPMIHYLNKSNIPYFTLTPDPRYHPVRARDLFNISKFSLSQYNSNNKSVKHIKSYENQDLLIDSITTEYSELETTFLYNMKKPLYKYNKSKIFTIIMNEGGNGGLLRGPFIEEFILKNNELNFKNSIEIYGVWNDNWKKKYPNNFKGTIKFNDLHKYLLNTKYTFIVPIDKGWVTAKFWEMIYFGVIPFLHPYYDEQNNLKVPEFLKIKNNKDLVNKINYLENDNEIYLKLLEELQLHYLKEKYFNGEHLNNLFYKGINKLFNKETFNYIDNTYINEINNKIKNNNSCKGFLSLIQK